MQKIVFTLILVALILAGGLLYFLKYTPLQIKPLQNISKADINILPTPTPFPFQEITIPFLREKEYKSKLGQLQKISDNGDYTSYLTDYSSDGLKINGLLTKPNGDMPTGGWPAIVFVHGYIPPKQYQTLEKYGDYVNFLARNGLVVFKIDLRGHGESEGEAGGAYYSSDYIIDTLNAYSALQSSEFINEEKIGLWGHSMAGNVVLRSMVVKPEIAAAVIWAGAVYTYEDFAEYGIADNSYRQPDMSSERVRRRRELLNLYGEPKDGNPFWKMVSPANYLIDLKGAIQLHHAVDDEVVDIGYSRNLNNLLDKTSVSHQFYEYRSGGHNISNSSFTEAMQRTVEFFKENLGY